MNISLDGQYLANEEIKLKTFLSEKRYTWLAINQRLIVVESRDSLQIKVRNLRFYLQLILDFL